MAYRIKKVSTPPRLNGDWNHPDWRTADVLDVKHFHADSSDHRPRTQIKALYDNNGLSLFFRVDDRYVVSQATQHQESVCVDSCVEFFVEPKPTGNYVNFEFNCGGTMLVHYNVRRDEDGNEIHDRTLVDDAWLARIPIFHSMPNVVHPEISEPVSWTLQYWVPFSLIAAYVGPLGTPSGQTWHGNFYKCADQCSHPHWASWSPIGPVLSFHQTSSFALIHFEG